MILINIEDPLDGEWWFPDSPGERYMGELKIHTSRISLELRGDIDLGDKDVLIGVTNEKGPVTLFRLQESETPFLTVRSGVRIPETRLDAEYCIIGDMFESEDDLYFDKAILKHPAIDSWLNLTSISLPMSEFFSEGNGPNKIELEVEEPKTEGINLSDVNIEFKVTAHGGPSFGVEGNEISIQDRKRIEIEINGQLELDRLQEIERYLRQFLALAERQPLGTEEILLESGKAKIGDTEISQKLRLYYPINSIYSSYERNPKRQPFFKYSTFPDEIEKLFHNFIDEEEKLREIINLLFISRRDLRRYSHQRFLNITQAIEALHRKFEGGKYMTDEDYREIYDNLLSILPPELSSDFRDSLEYGLKFENEFSLRKRIKILAERIDGFEELIDDIKVFSKKVSDTRNYFNHYTEKLRKKAVVDNPQEFRNIIQKIEILLDLSILYELGLRGRNLKKCVEMFNG